MTKRTVGIAVILLWVGGLALFARRQIVRSPGERLLAASLRISPATYYYIVELNGVQIGAAMSAIDTTADAIITSDFFTGRYPVGKDTLRMTARANSSYSRTLLLKDFAFVLEGDQLPVTMLGRAHGDSLLVVETDSPGNSGGTSRLRITSPVFTPTVAPVVGMLSKDRNLGDTIHVSIFDPIAREPNLVTIQVYEDTLFLITDSATLDRKTNAWHASWTDTVRARRLGGKGSSLTVWVDNDGRIVAASESGGIRMIRSAYELAFKRGKSDPPAKDESRK